MAYRISELQTTRSNGSTIGLATPTDLLFIQYSAAERHHRLASAAHRRRFRRHRGA